jgi:hypothetical protein
MANMARIAKQRGCGIDSRDHNCLDDIWHGQGYIFYTE